MPPISRRAFLAATGGILVAAACGGSNGGGSRATRDELVGLRVAADQYASSMPQRFAFAVTKEDRFFDGPDARIAFAPPDVVSALPQGAGYDEISEDDLSPYRAARLRSDGLPEDRGIYEVQADLPEPGFWVGRIEMEGSTFELPFQVTPLPSTLVPGEAAYRAPSPTFTDTLGVDPICTRDPECGLHDVSLDEVIGSGRPVVVLFGTPARCQTQYCGPVLDLLLDVKGAFDGRVAVVHVEIFRNLETPELVPTVEAWTLESEPWLFGIGGDGAVTQRLAGAWDRGETRELLEAVAATASPS